MKTFKEFLSEAEEFVHEGFENTKEITKDEYDQHTQKHADVKAKNRYGKYAGAGDSGFLDHKKRPVSMMDSGAVADSKYTFHTTYSHKDHGLKSVTKIRDKKTGDTTYHLHDD